MAYMVLAGESLDRAFAAVRLGYVSAEPSDVHALRPASCANTADELRRIDLSVLEGVLPAHKPVELFVPDRASRRRFPEFAFSVCPEEFPPGSFWELAPRVLMYSPEQYFVHKARRLGSLVDRVKLGMELCGTYCFELPAREDLRCAFDVPAASTPERLRAHALKARGLYGVKAAREAAGLVVGNSYSPRETMVVLEQCLPLELGGRGYPIPELNKELWVPRDKRHLVARDVFKPDIYWEAARLDEEYEGRYHNTDEMVERDKARLADIQSLGIQVIPATALSLRSFERAELLGRQVGMALAERAYGQEMVNHLRVLEGLDLMAGRQELHASLSAPLWSRGLEAA